MNPRLYIKDILIHIVQKSIRRFPAAILMYHSIGTNPHFFTVTPEEFRWQMSYLKDHGYRVLPLLDLVDLLMQKKSIPTNTVVLTFDDGYEDNFTNAFPILKEFQFPATIFVSTDFIGQERTVRGVPMRHLTREQIIDMYHLGLIDIQPHGASHRKLTELDADEIKKEMVSSQSVLLELIGSPRKLFAYPYGATNELATTQAREIFDAAVIVNRGYVSWKSDIMKLQRQSIDSKTTRARFKLKV